MKRIAANRIIAVSLVAGLGAVFLVRSGLTAPKTAIRDKPTNAIPGNSSHVKVGAWDIDDIRELSADARSRLVGDPPSSVSAKGYKATLPSGLSVELYAISRHSTYLQPGYQPVNSQSWSPDGSPYTGKENLGASGPSQMPDTIPSPREGKGARYLAFRLTSPSKESIEVYGYVPNSAQTVTDNPTLRGYGLPGRTTIEANMPLKYRTGVVVENNDADEYLLAVSQGPWSTISESDRPSQALEPKKTISIAEKWGRLDITLNRYMGYSGPERNPDYVTVIATPKSEPQEYAYRIAFLDKNGNDLTKKYGPSLELRRGPMTDRMDIPEVYWNKVSQIKVEARKLTYVRFKDVHYYPDARLWPDAYWGNEGSGLAHVVKGVGKLNGILRCEPGARFDEPARLYAADGKRWLDFPNRDAIQNGWFGNPIQAKQSIALFELEDVPWICESRIRVYTSDSPEPGKGSLKQIAEPWITRIEGGDRRDYHSQYTTVYFDCPKQVSYLQFEVNLPGDAWKSIGSIEIPKGPFFPLTKELKQSLAKSPNTIQAPFSFYFRGTGSLAIGVAKAGSYEVVLTENVLKFGTDGRSTRLVAALKDGKRKVLSWQSSSGIGDVSYSFSYLANGQIAYINRLAALEPETILLKDIDHFEVEQRPYKESVWFVCKAPAKEKK